MEATEKRKCSERVYKDGDSWHLYQCDNNAVEGSDKCGVHHPDAVKRRGERSKLKRAAKDRVEEIRRLRFAAQILRRRGRLLLADEVDAEAEAMRK